MTVIAGQDVAPFDIDATEAWWLVPERLFDGETLDTGRAVRIVAGRIDDLHPVVEAGRDDLPVWRTNGLASPGFFDVQVNGGGGVMVNGTPTADGLRAIAAAHRPGGTTAILPTLITDAPEVMEKAVSAVIAAVGRDGIVGVHLEGPHISVARKGAHNPRFIRPIDDDTLSCVRRLRAANVPVLLTLAPECVPPGTIASLRAMGVVVSLGHTAADAATTRAAIAEGARAVTHLYNAMTPITSREPGVVGAALDSDLYCGFIADGHHVDDAVLRLAIRSRPMVGRMVLVSDAMSTWNGPDHFTLYGETIRLEGGKLVNSIGSLAGVHTDMATSLRRLVDVVGVPLEDALKMATANPSRLMRLEANVGFLRPGMPADIVLLGGL
ncbi:N-acetylglucosamine-6-phosphate deacetylase [Shinella sp. 838]|jgi:N-acetylglucosamine-6-phosphate deacetylase|uniref:N-acetylglucosamine-6-phosphate deacetylase n=1 Tax=unclassified Shinella TaxID=2643062 RepID=UPI00102D5575|nr:MULTISPECIES: N-acetylglucosamine-6-phosphate deacetylase [unclassified Shinella]MCA0341758.1 N-acetylglucosamine-6-phosphate deacetylase [Pseudomonadota bacterium]MDG4672764.1 N-acetylglucosamine-6-phosphate deacetylase [Shinella sp. 838]TAA64233.1 N-acetylglucosamine-6-phosphate deacetylase [Shinella sp. JR1-6]